MEQNIMFDRLGYNPCVFINIAVPRVGEQVYLDEETYKVQEIKHFPEGGKGLKGYEKFKKPFVKVLLSSISYYHQ